MFAAGPLMKNLVFRLSAEKVAAHVDSSDELIDAICAEIRPGDAVMVKGLAQYEDGPHREGYERAVRRRLHGLRR